MEFFRRARLSHAVLLVVSALLLVSATPRGEGPATAPGLKLCVRGGLCNVPASPGAMLVLLVISILAVFD